MGVKYSVYSYCILIRVKEVAKHDTAEVNGPLTRRGYSTRQSLNIRSPSRFRRNETGDFLRIPFWAGPLSFAIRPTRLPVEMKVYVQVIRIFPEFQAHESSSRRVSSLVCSSSPPTPKHLLERSLGFTSKREKEIEHTARLPSRHRIWFWNYLGCVNEDIYKQARTSDYL